MPPVPPSPTDADGSSGPPEVVPQPGRRRYALLLDGEEIAFADAREVRPGVLVMDHTVVDPRHGGRGHGATLVRGALDDVRRRGAVVVPTCWFVARYVRPGGEYADLLADG